MRSDRARVRRLDLPPADPDLAPERREKAARGEQGRRLAGAVRTEEGDDLSLGDVERHVAHHRELSVAGDEVANGEQLAQRAPPGGSTLDGVLSEVRAQHLRVAADLGRRARCDEAAGVEHVDVVADREHERHVVVDEEQARPRRGELAERARRAPRSRAGRGPRPARRASAARAERRSRARTPPTCARPARASSGGGRRRRRARAARAPMRRRRCPSRASAGSRR